MILGHLRELVCYRMTAPEGSDDLGELEEGTIGSY